MVNLNQSINAYKNYVREERKFHGYDTKRIWYTDYEKGKKKWKDKMIWKN